MAKSKQHHQAILFFDDSNNVVKEILYPEFEAVLDHYVGMLDFENQTLKAVYLHIDYQLKITGAVFFMISFDSKGFVDQRWNIPLLQLMDKAELGINLGAGPIKMCTSAQCPISNYQSMLWDPGNDQVIFNRLSNTISRNNLCLTASAEGLVNSGLTPPILQSVAKGGAGDLKHHIRQQMEAEFDSRLSTAMATAELGSAKSFNELQAEISQLKDALTATKDIISDEKNKNRLLKETLDNQASELQKSRERYQQEITKTESINDGQLELLQEQFEIEAQARIDAACKELKERLEMREAELFHRDESLSQLRTQFDTLKQQQDLLADGEANLLEKMLNSGITFLVDYPGGEQLTIPLEKVYQYLEAPMQYLADHCGVDLAIYKQWLYHCELPVCNANLDSGRVCGKPISKVNKPIKFTPGESDRCSSHRQSSDKLQQVIKMRSPG
jgi:hypothetical protein